MRSLVFLNHATPEDNQFTAWLAAKLTLAGYEVWCDFHRLRGGQDFWQEIEKTIREKTCRFIAITSRVGQDKKGVRNEIAAALIVEKEIPDFLVPIRLDDLPFTEFKINVLTKNAIDFNGNWEKGLRSLLKTLDEAKVPRKAIPDVSLALPWMIPDEQLKIRQRSSAETLETNWLEIKSIPEVINSVEIRGGAKPIERTEDNYHVLWFQHRELLCGFATALDLEQNFSTTCPTKRGPQVALSVFLEGRSKTFIGLKAVDTARIAVRLLRQAWGLKMRRLHLQPFSVEGKLAGWFVPNNLLLNNKKEFTDASGKKRRKNLVGRSEKNQVYWHFGVSAYPSLADPRRFELRTHVLFTEDGQTPLDSATRMHRLRRSFCRNWWNDHFRSLFRAFLAFISGDSDSIVLPTGGEQRVVLSSSPIQWQSPVSLSDVEELPEELISTLEEEPDQDFDDEEDEPELTPGTDGSAH